MPTPQATQTQPSSQGGDVFDAVSSGQYTPGQQFQVQQQAQQPTQGGDVFDQITSGTTTTPGASATPTAHNDELQITAPATSIKGIAQRAGSVFEGVGEGLFGTAAGAGDLIDKATGMKPGAVSRELHTLAGDDNTPGSSNAYNKTGYGGETLMEFLTGDEALKGLSLSDRLLKSAGIAKALENSPRIMKALQIGADALRVGTVQGTQTLVRTGGDATAAGEQGLLAAGTAGALNTAIEAAPAIKKAFSLKAVQDALQNSKASIQEALQSNLESIQNAWHGSVRDLFDQVANEAGVKPDPAESIRDVAANVADAVKSRASGMYRQIDQALGGTRFQTYDEQLGNVRRALRNSAGIDPDADGRLIERINDLEDAKAKAMDMAKAAGVDPKLIDQANSAWRQGSALEDLSKHIQNSTSGLRGDLAQGVNAAPESLSPAKLATRANRLYDTGRLQQALGGDRADDLLRAIETTKQKAADAAENAVKQTEAAASKAAASTDTVKLRRYVAGAALAGIPGFELLKHLLGE
jgi:hypothetical protein